MENSSPLRIWLLGGHGAGVPFPTLNSCGQPMPTLLCRHLRWHYLKQRAHKLFSNGLRLCFITSYSTTAHGNTALRVLASPTVAPRWRRVIGSSDEPYSVLHPLVRWVSVLCA